MGSPGEAQNPTDFNPPPWVGQGGLGSSGKPGNPGKAKKRLILGSTFEVVLLPCFWLFLKGIIKEELFSGPKQEPKRGLINIAIWWLPGRQFLDPVAQFWPSFSIPKLCAKLTKCP